jgi:hypothetical protein
MATGMLTLACLLWTIGPVPADVVPINQGDFQIPIKIDPARRDEIKELQLFYSMDQGRTWQQIAVAAPDSASFPFHAPTDGTYWFSVCVVDRKGNREPRDINAAPPGQKVLIDTLKPVVRIASVERQADDVVVAWEIQEDHPDLATLKLEYRSPDSPSWMWTNGPVTPAVVGQTRIRAPGAGPLVVRVQIQDLAGNQAMAQAEVKGSQPAPVSPPAPGPAPSTAAVSPPGLSPAPHVPTLPLNPPATPGRSPTQDSAWERGPAGQSPVVPAMEQRAWSKAHPAGAVPLGGAAMEGGTRLVASTETVPNPATPAPVPGGPRMPRGAPPAVQITNTPQVSLEYEVTKVGPSGVGLVELYATMDDGREWRLLAQDPDLKSPITAELPGEGVYGFWLVVKSRVGMGRRAPQSGDLPQMRVEIDTTPPVAELYAPELAPQRRDALVISWKASDRNLGPNPISIQWAERPDALWQNIGVDLANTGRYTWQLPQRVPDRVYLRLSVRDTAGNVSTAETPEPIIVDLNEPEGQLKGIVPPPRGPE